jgi:hypothetical protein
MSDWTETDDFDNDDSAESGNQGNNTIKALRDKQKADAALLKEMRKELDELRDVRKSSVVGEVLRSTGVNPAVAKFYNGDAEPAAVQAWVEENRELFGVQTEAASPGAPVQDAPPAISPTEQAAYQRVIDAGVDGVPPSNYNDAMSALLAANSREELAEVYKRFGG